MSLDSGMINIKVPCSSANLGPGFDTLGLALSLYLELQICVVSASSSKSPLNCEITCEGLGAESIRKRPDENLITQVALYVLRCHGKHAFTELTKVHINNRIPLSRGLGSSAAAVVAGVMLANEVERLGMTQKRCLDFCLMVERHPDNITAALYGGFICACLTDLNPDDLARIEIPLAEVLPEPAGGIDTGKMPPIPPIGVGQFQSMRLSPAIRAVVVIPNFKVDTAKARGVLPNTYSRQDAVFNNQRIGMLMRLLSQPPDEPEQIHGAMQDRLHQQYRAGLVPGLSEIVRKIKPSSHPGVLGVCLSGAGPTILALATQNFEKIAQAIIDILMKANKNIQCQWQVLEPTQDGATVTREKEHSLN